MIAGGGTGGHLYPGIAIARELVARGHPTASLHFVGARRGLEGRTRATEPFPTTLLPGRGLQRSLRWPSLMANGMALAGELAAVAAAVALFATWRPAVVVSLGGYASLPAVAAALVWRVPLVVVNVDAAPGAANRVAARFACACAVGQRGVELPHTVFTGVPVRAEMAAVERGPAGRAAARERLGIPLTPLVVAVSGGSLGSRRVNEATVQLADLWAGRTDVYIYHVVGRRDWDSFGPRPGDVPRPFYKAVPYEEDMASLYSAADVAVQRAGANTVAELALAGLPSVLVPLPGAPGDHQSANARAMASAGGAVVVPDAELDGERLAQELGDLLAGPGRLAEMGGSAQALATPRATAEVTDVVEQCARKGAGGPGAHAGT
ncbi:MAG TPA: UDP-N-acetylglucosamine--N-acetylmuramyl-(pentapeptide) pyrophosphoryl-undecaprenol N-acetylglucosamine transferase [Acidimicrobiales bacterium]|nr:UDP-N-acetylglucosamine--N-acetylmuramyl-(pentapeptide) pyrophosphoryl-undecaprenol N-acetylglucosamine transferase [Acidimicrobiales bacterium]